MCVCVCVCLSVWVGGVPRNIVTNKNNLINKWNLKEGNVLFNDALNTFYLWFYGKEGRKYFI